MARPSDLKYSRTHEWVRVEGDVATVGITDYAVEQLGDLAFVDLPEVGGSAKQGERFGEIESTKAVSDLVSPVSGEIVEVNSEVVDDLELISGSPFEKGWLVRIRLSALEELEPLLTDDGYATAIESEEH
jgi:glycine cleavage system H protein